MNDTINPASNNQSINSVTAVSANTKSRLEGRNAVDTTDSSVNEKSFQDSIDKAFDDSRQEKEITETESGGNDLPLSNGSPDSTEDDDRLLSMVDLQSQIPDQWSIQNKPVEQETIANIELVLPDIEASADDKLNVFLSQPDQHIKMEQNISNELNLLPPQTRQLLNLESNIKGKKAQLLSNSNTTATINTVEESVISQLNSNQIELAGQKSQGLSTAIQQQQMLSNNQTSLLSQTMSVQPELNNDGFPLLLNQSVNNFSAMNMQSIPQGEIVEMFARPKWSQGMGKQILWMVNQNISSAEIRLNPAHLGPIEVLINMSEDQVNVSLSSRHAIVREAMEQALPKLREMLGDNGFNLADTDISQHSFAQQREQNTENTNTGLTGDSSDQSITSEINEQAIKQLSASTAMVDYYI